MITTNRVTHLGYAAIADSKEHLVKTPKVLHKIPVRLSAGVGVVYFSSSFALLQAGGASKELILPLLGIAAAFVAFMYQTVTLVAGWRYRRRLRKYAERGTVVFVPLPLVQHAETWHQNQGQTMHPSVFDTDLHKTHSLVELYKQEGLSPGVKKLLQSLC